MPSAQSRSLGATARDWLPPVLTRWLQKKREPRYMSIHGLDRKLEELMNFDGGFYVELGANDGKTQSNSWYFNKHRGWRGVLVEPSQSNYFKCRENRPVGNSIYCAACVSFDYPHEFVKIAYANLMSAPIGLESDVENPHAHARKGAALHAQTEEIFEFGALARPLSILLDQSNAPAEMDFLSLDVEGAELEVLKGIDHERHRFRYLLIEGRDLERLRLYLEPHGYQFIENLSPLDRLFRNVRRSAQTSSMLHGKSGKT
jgi:FkbM family methyltransferase